MYDYLIATLILCAVWGLIFLIRKDLRQPLFWGGGVYVFLIVPVTFLVKALGQMFEGVSWRFPDSWLAKETLWNLGAKTGIMGIEDVLLMIVVGGLAATAYEIFSPHRIRNTEKHHHILSVITFLVSYVAIAFLSPWDPVWNLILSSFLGWLVIMIQRRDLFFASIAGAFTFFTVYVIGFLLYHMATGEVAWNLKNLTVIAYPFPLKELLYALSLGLIWTPLYEYVTGKSIT
ncbi:MAG: hypothetical protein Q8R20_00165 [Nanoarchaeota archaeon]|nr:hypothetical protein [Nanoarchaeota archaeon]